jgi:hypothetical protein
VTFETAIRGRNKMRPLTAVLITTAASAVVVTFPIVIVLAVVLKGSNETLFWILSTAPALAIFVFGALRIAIAADEDEIVVTNLWKTHSLRWAQVHEIDSPDAFWPGAAILSAATPPIRIQTREGRRVYVAASVDNAARVADFLRRSSSYAKNVKWGTRVR